MDFYFLINHLFQNKIFDSYILKIYFVGVVVLIPIYFITGAGEDVNEDVSKILAQ